MEKKRGGKETTNKRDRRKDKKGTKEKKEGKKKEKSGEKERHDSILSPADIKVNLSALTCCQLRFSQSLSCCVLKEEHVAFKTNPG